MQIEGNKILHFSRPLFVVDIIKLSRILLIKGIGNLFMHFTMVIYRGNVPVKSKTNLLIYRLVFFFFAVSAFGLTQSQLTQRVVITEGVAALSGNRGIERDRAIQDALKNAVEQAIGTLVSSESMTMDFKLIYDKILTKSQGYIKSYRVVSERVDGDVYRVEIEANVGMGMIINDLAAIGLLLERKNLPRVLVLIGEQNISIEGPSGFSLDMSQAETEFLNKLTNKGFYCVDAKTIKSALSREISIKAIEGDIRAAQAIGLECGAELVITGKASASSQRVAYLDGSGMKSVRADVTARAIEVDNGKILAADSASRPAALPSEAAAGTEAIKLASDLLADKMIETILSSWTIDTTSSSLVQVQISDLRSLTDLERFKEIIKDKIRGVQSIFQRYFALNSARLEIRLSGNAQSLAQDIQRTRFEYFKAIVTSVSQNVVTVKLLYE